MSHVLAEKNIVLAVTGGIAAYKSAELVRLLVKNSARVQVLMTSAASEFITPLTLGTLSGRAVATDMFAPIPEGGIGHIELASRADLIIVAPATANVLARMAAGMADDLVTAVLLATKSPILLAPAMNTNMWENPLTRANLDRLTKLSNVSIVGPDSGNLACGWEGAGRMSEPSDIAAAAEVCLARQVAGLLPSNPLRGKTVVVTAGPTWEAVDDVRFLGNRSSGKMGFAMARAAVNLGAQVTIIAGPVHLPTPPGVLHRVDVESALEMRQALQLAAKDADGVVMAAAVADFRPGVRVLGKLSRRSKPRAQESQEPSLSLVPNPDLLAELGLQRKTRRPFLVGFAAEVGTTPATLVERARVKVKEKRCDVIVANEVGRPNLGFGADENAVTLVFASGKVVDFPASRKELLAARIWDCIASEIAETPEPMGAVPKKTNKQRSLRKKIDA